MEVNNARDQNRQLQIGGRFLAIRNAMNECANLQEASINGISTKINNIQESTSKPETVREEVKILLTDLNKSMQNLLDYMHSLEKLKMLLPKARLNDCISLNVNVISGLSISGFIKTSRDYTQTKT